MVLRQMKFWINTAHQYSTRLEHMRAGNGGEEMLDEELEANKPSSDYESGPEVSQDPAEAARNASETERATLPAPPIARAKGKNKAKAKANVSAPAPARAAEAVSDSDHANSSSSSSSSDDDSSSSSSSSATSSG